VGTALDSIDFALDEMPGEELHDVLRAYREERGPVAATHFLGLPAFVISSHEALLDAFRDVERFPPHLMYELSFEGAVGRSFISMGDAKEHLVYRKLATPAFRSRALQRFEAEGLAPLASELVDDLGDDAEVDLVEGFSARLPYLVISRMLGLPRERESEFHGWAKAQLAFRDDPVAAEKAKAELTNCLAPVVEARRSEPRDDVISELVAAEVDGRSLSDEEIHARSETCSSRCSATRANGSAWRGTPRASTLQSRRRCAGRRRLRCCPAARARSRPGFAASTFRRIRGCSSPLPGPIAIRRSSTTPTASASVATRAMRLPSAAV